MPLISSILAPSSAHAYNPPPRDDSSADANNQTAGLASSGMDQSEAGAAVGASESGMAVNDFVAASNSRPAPNALTSAPSANLQAGDAPDAAVQLQTGAFTGGLSNPEDLFSSLFNNAGNDIVEPAPVPEAQNANKNALAELYASTALGDEAPQSIERKA